jgi:predicted GIY-YIG superfamily endonuclease
MQQLRQSSINFYNIMKKYRVYMMTERNKTVIYTELTNDLERRIQDNEGYSFTKNIILLN